MDAQRERIATLLAADIPSSGVATIVGLSPGRISQIMKEEGFELAVEAKRAESKDKDVEEVSLSGKYLAAEHALLKQVIDMAPTAELRDATAALRVVAERQERAKTRMNPIVHAAPVYNTVVQLQLPQHAVPELRFSSAKEVIAIENRNLAPLSSSGVLNLFKGMEGNQNEVTASLPNNTLQGVSNEPTRTLTETTGSASSTLPQQEKLVDATKLADGAKRFLDSLHPAPSALSY